MPKQTLASSRIAKVSRQDPQSTDFEEMNKGEQTTKPGHKSFILD